MRELRARGTDDTGRALDARIEAVSWGLFFIWTGIAFLAHVGWGAGILGVGAITLGAQVARRAAGLPAEPFWIVMGLGMIAWGAWPLLGLRHGVMPFPRGWLPMLLIAFGVVLVVRALLRTSTGQGRDDGQAHDVHQEGA